MSRIGAKLQTILLVFAVFAGCDKGRKSPTSPPPPGRPTGISNATALANLSLVLQLEKQARSTTVLASVFAFAHLDGHVGADGGWDYTFIDVRPNLDQAYVWSVEGTGIVNVVGPVPPTAHLDLVDLAPSLVLDSDRATSLARGYGADAYIAKHPNAIVQITYRFLGGQPICHLHYLDNSSGRDGCEIDIYLHASSGALMARDLSCLSGG
jgi:hypothetical protein